MSPSLIAWETLDKSLRYLRVLAGEGTERRDINANSFVLRILGKDGDEDEGRIYLAQKIETRRSLRNEFEESREPAGFTVERAAEIIEYLPSDIPRESALRIIRGTLAAAGIDGRDLSKSTLVQEAKLNIEMKLTRNRQKELREKTGEVIRSLRREINKAQDAYEAILAREEREILT